jgi:hypothetical protein
MIYPSQYTQRSLVGRHSWDYLELYVVSVARIRVPRWHHAYHEDHWGGRSGHVQYCRGGGSVRGDAGSVFRNCNPGSVGGIAAHALHS